MDTEPDVPQLMDATEVEYNAAAVAAVVVPSVPKQLMKVGPVGKPETVWSTT